jgi:hypothetical protein
VVWVHLVRCSSEPYRKPQLLPSDQTECKSLQALKEISSCGNIHFVFLTDPRSPLQTRKKKNAHNKRDQFFYELEMMHITMVSTPYLENPTTHKKSEYQIQLSVPEKTPQTPSKSLVVICKRVYISHTLPPRIITIITHPIQSDRKQPKKKTYPPPCPPRAERCRDDADLSSRPLLASLFLLGGRRARE